MVKKKPVKPEKVEPLWIKGKFYCPRCQDRDHLHLAKHNCVSGKPGLICFKWICIPCNVTFEIEEGL